MAKTSHLSHVIITQTTKPHAAGAHNLGAHVRKKRNYALSPLRHTWYLFMCDQFFFILCYDPFSYY